MAELAMAEAAGRLAIDDEPDADPRADGDVSEIVEALARTPAHLGERGAVDVCVECRGHARRALQPPGDVRALPPRLGSARYGAEAGRVRVEVERPEAADSKRFEFPP